MAKSEVYSSAKGIVKEAGRINKSLITARRARQKDLATKRNDLAAKKEKALGQYDIGPYGSYRINSERSLLLPYVLELAQEGKKPSVFLLARETVRETGGILSGSRVFALGKGAGVADPGIEMTYQTDSGPYFLIHLKSDQAGLPVLTEVLFLADAKKGVFAKKISFKQHQLGSITIKGITNPSSDMNLSYDVARSRVGKILVPTPKA